MPMKNKWWRRKAEGDDPSDGAETQAPLDRAVSEIEDEIEEEIEDEHALAEAAAPPDPLDDPELDDEQRSFLRAAASIEGEADEARQARARVVEQISALRKTERDAIERAMREEAEGERAAQERQTAERAASELAEAEAQAIERAAEERAAAEAAARRRAEAERLVREHSEAERQALERAQSERANAERASTERQQAENTAAETAQREREISESASAMRQRAEEAIDRRRAAEKSVDELTAKERALRARLAADRAAAARSAAERSVAAQEALERAQAELALAERQAAERAQAARSIAERLAKAQQQAAAAQSALGRAEETLAELGGDELEDDDPPALELVTDDEAELDSDGDPDAIEASAAAVDDQDEAEERDEAAVEAGAEESTPETSDRKVKGASALAPLILIASLIGGASAGARLHEPDPAEAAVVASVPALSVPARMDPADLAPTDPAASARDLRPAWVRYAAPSTPRPSGAPTVALVIDDMGVDPERSAEAIALPAPLTLAFLPYAEEVDAQAARARDAGHELLVHVPMEPDSRHHDPGPNALHVDLDASQIEQRLDWAFSRVPGVVGINNHMGSRFTRDPDRMRLVVRQLARNGLLFLDSMTSQQSVAWRIAQNATLPYASRDVFLDHDAAPSRIRAQLDLLARTARRQGVAVGIGHPRPNTLRALAEWLPAARRQGIHFAPITAVARHATSL